MKAKTAIMMFYLAALIVGGCIPSLHPLYTDQTLIFDEALIGKWIGRNDSGDEMWQFSKADEKEYELRIVKDEKEGRFSAHLLELDGKKYLDLYPGENESMENLNDYYKLHLISAHTFLWINLTEPNLQLIWFMQKLLEDDPNLLRHETVDKDQIILTASTEELQRFVIENAERIDPDGAAEFIRMEQLFAEEDIIFDENLLGVWESENCERISFKNNGQDFCYNVTFTDSDDNEHKFKAIAFTIEDMTLLAAYYSEPTDNEIECGQELMPDMFVAVEQIEPTLLLNKLDYEQAKEIISSGKLPVQPNKQYDFEGSRI